ncbi:hypothetical protein COT50_02370 [candidate division WWE3 bacterium CG08_land_8_20_14_0_20_41_10]|uniref:Antitoxin n=1 Tax=candidate division WWE3 bacterium CG08_land_8_20_14_0_20_41_10 TaxID=1975085 RepID=A0A2H0XBS9_UNCKA|nr:MAG: hypothetical protein COT50_02370 [candidate division WWE3 bacterium CG08_land_8_20_14_0_20_41_10]
MYKQVNLTQARQNLSSIIGDVYMNNYTYFVSKSNIPMVRIERVVPNEMVKYAANKDLSWRALGDEIFGSWKGIKDSVSYGRKLRRELELGL